jgi:hypothetical protein
MTDGRSRSDTSRSGDSGWPLWWVFLLLIVIVVYGQSVFFGFVVFDDHTYILQNPTIAQPSQARPLDLILTPQMRYIIPVTVVPQAVLYQIGGGAAWPFHLANVALHGAFVVLIFGLARALGASVVAAFAAALLVGVHPVCAEPVAWATGFKDVAMGVLALAGTLCFVLAADAESRRRSTVLAALAVVFALAAALAKPAALVLGLAWIGWLVARWRPWSGGRGERRPERRLIVAVAVSSLCAAVLGAANYVMYRALIRAPEVPVDGAFKPLMALGWQAHHLVWPVNLHPIYPVERGAGFADPHTWLGLGLCVLLCAVVWLARNRANILLGVGLAVVLYLPASNILPFPRFLADSYLYAPMAGIAVAVAVAVTRLPDAAVIVVATALSLVMSFSTAEQVARWENGEALWTPLVEAHPTWGAGHVYLGHARFVAGDFRGAVEAFTGGFSRFYDRDALGNLAISLDRVGSAGEAQCVFTEAALRDPDPANLRNLSVFAARHPEIAWTWPGHVRHLLAAPGGGLALPRSLGPGLARAQARLASAGQPLPLPAGPLCSVTGAGR